MTNFLHPYDREWGVLALFATSAFPTLLRVLANLPAKLIVKCGELHPTVDRHSLPATQIGSSAWLSPGGTQTTFWA